jgi:hypothetical protein
VFVCLLLAIVLVGAACGQSASKVKVKAKPKAHAFAKPKKVSFRVCMASKGVRLPVPPPVFIRSPTTVPLVTRLRRTPAGVDRAIYWGALVSCMFPGSYRACMAKHGVTVRVVPPPETGPIKAPQSIAAQLNARPKGVSPAKFKAALAPCMAAAARAKRLAAKIKAKKAKAKAPTTTTTKKP